MNSNLKITIKILAFWSLFMGMAPLLYRPLGYNYDNAPLLLSSHFILTTLLGIKLFYQDGLKDLIREYDLKVLIGVILFYTTVFSLINYYYPADPQKISEIQARGVVFVSFTPSVLTTKAFDIIFQQVLSYLLIAEYLKIVDKRKSVLYFTLFFGVLHIPLLAIFGLMKGSLFLFPSMLGGLVFAYLISHKRLGKEMAIAVHYSFYVFLGVYLRYF